MTGLTIREAEQELWRAAPHDLADVAEQVVTTFAKADAAGIFLADYRMTRLLSVVPGRPAIPLNGNAEERAFATQRPVLEPPPALDPAAGWRLHLPLTAQGDRLGVLVVTTPQAPPAERQAELAGLAVTLSRALYIADRVTDRYLRARRRQRLTLAAEMQWELLPGRAHTTPEYDFGGQLEPAYTVCGDHFDWAADRDALTLAVTDGMGEGIEAALLTQLAVSALRNARRSGADLAEQAGLADEALFGRYHGRRYVATLLLRFDLATGEVTAIDAGSPLIYRLRGGDVDIITLDRQLPLGMFGDTRYAEQRFTLEPGDRLVIVSDGVHGVRLENDKEDYGPGLLVPALRETRLLPAFDTVRALLRGLVDHHAGVELADDAVIVCLDWTGR